MNKSQVDQNFNVWLCFKTIDLPVFLILQMDHKGNIDALKQQYFVLSRDFLVALQQDRSSEELEVIRKQIREIVVKIEVLDRLQDGEMNAAQH